MADITAAAKKGRTGQTSSEQLESILNWIELSSNNYNLLVGKSTQNLSGVVAGMKLSKTAAYNWKFQRVDGKAIIKNIN